MSAMYVVTFVESNDDPQGITPGAWVANYSASKAALHSLCYSLHAHLQGTNVHIMEIIPPLVESELHDGAYKNSFLFFVSKYICS